jgi:hypothetical protein
MPYYDPADLAVFDPILTNFSTGWSDQRLHGLSLFPETQIASRSGRYRVFDRSNWLVYRSRREPGTVANEIGRRKWSEDTFSVKEHSLQAAVADEEDEELNSPGGLGNPYLGGDLAINPHRDAQDDIMTSLMLEHEMKVSTQIRDVANYPANHKVTLTAGATGTRWSNYAANAGVYYSDPVTNLRYAVQRIHLDTGRWPTDMIIPFDAVGVIELHPGVQEKFKYFSLVNEEDWKKLLGLPQEGTSFRVTVVESKYNAADNIDLAESIQSFWGTDVWLGIVDDTPGQKTMTFGKTFSRPYGVGGVRPTDRWRETDRKSDLVRTSWRWDTKIVSSVAGYLFTTAVTAIV